MGLRTDEAGVEAAGVGGVGGALNDSASVGEDGDGVLAAAEAEEEIVAAEVMEVGVEGEAVAEGGEVDGAVVLMDLYGVAAAEGDVGAAFAGEVGEDALAADGAVGIGVGGADLGLVDASGCGRGPEVEGEEGAAEEMVLVREDLEGFGDLEGGGEVDGGAEDAGGVAGFYWAGGGLGEDAGEAGGGFVGTSEYVASLRP